MKEVLRVEQLTHVYGPGTPFEKTAVDKVDFSALHGEFIALIGHTGSGKSTLIQHFNGLLRPTAGRVLINGEDIYQTKEITRAARFAVGLVFQYPEYQLFEETVYADVAFGPKNMGLEKAEIDRRVRENCRITGIPEELLEKSPFELSGGQKRRVALAGVFAMEPEVLVLGSLWRAWIRRAARMCSALSGNITKSTAPPSFSSPTAWNTRRCWPSASW